jgi:hypothetical protein
MTKEKLDALARKVRQMAEALQCATEGRFTTKTAKELWDDYGADTEFDEALVYQTHEMLAIWTPDQNIEVWDFEGFGDEPPSINLATSRATF